MEDDLEMCKYKYKKSRKEKVDLAVVVVKVF